jgi:hypothetical protein
VILSANPVDEARAAVFGVRQSLRKPIDGRVLETAVRRHCERHARRSSEPMTR